MPALALCYPSNLLFPASQCPLILQAEFPPLTPHPLPLFPLFFSCVRPLLRYYILLQPPYTAKSLFSFLTPLSSSSSVASYQNPSPFIFSDFYSCSPHFCFSHNTAHSFFSDTLFYLLPSLSTLPGACATRWHQKEKKIKTPNIWVTKLVPKPGSEVYAAV